MPRLADIDRYVLRALVAGGGAGGVREVTLRANRLLAQDGATRWLTQRKTGQILDFLAAESMAAKQDTDPVTWMITPRGRGNL